MTPSVLERTQFLPLDIAAAWDFFCVPGNLARITPADMGFTVTSPETRVTYAGQIITYTVSPLFGITLDWVTEITHVQEPFFFVDEQRFGPYRFWHHQHRFTPVDGGVQMTDLVHYLLPHMPFPGLADRLLVAPRLKQIFDYREKILRELFC